MVHQRAKHGRAALKPRLFFALLPLMTFLTEPAAAQGSLFFTQDEVQKIEKEIQRAPATAVQAKHLLHLGSILYYGPEKWTLWLRGEKWTPETDRPDIHVIGVDSKMVRLSVTLQSGRVLSDVALRPHQSLNLLTGKIVEGY